MKIVLILAGTLFLSGCAGALNLSRYAERELDNRTVSYELPQYIKDKKKPKVAVLPFSDTTQFGKSANLSQVAQESLTQLIVENCGVEVVERAQIEGFMQEMKLQSGITGEMDAEKFMSIAKDVDMVFVGAISSAVATHRFKEGKSWTDKKGKQHYIQPSCTEMANVAINFRALASPSGTIQQVFQTRGRKSFSREVGSSAECRVQNPGALLSEAIANAIDDSREALIDAFPALGYIYKTMTGKNDPRNRIAFINLGKVDGVEPGNRIDIIEFVREKDRVKGNDRVITRVIAEGVVSETDLQPEGSILLIPEDAADRIFVGQAVRTKANMNFIRSLRKSLR